MPKTKQQKESEVSKLSGSLKESATSVFVGFSNLPIGEEQELRSNLKESGVNYRVTKKTLFTRALAEAGFEGDPLEGITNWQFALATGDDAIAPAKGVADFAKERKEQMVILGGIFEGKLVDQAQMTEIASIPGMDVLRGMFVNVINSPIQGLALALNAIAEKKS